MKLLELHMVLVPKVGLILSSSEVGYLSIPRSCNWYSDTSFTFRWPQFTLSA